MSPPLAPEERASLLALARASIEERLRGGRPVAETLERVELTQALSEPRGAFVTLKLRPPGEHEQLRGCIGSMEGHGPLYRTVIDVARQAAFEDPRFPPLAQDELARVRLEISALSPLRAIPGPEAIELGRHGVELVRGRARAIFLPQVALEHGWDVPTLLAELAMKAGLAAGDWRGAELSVFTTEHMEEPCASDA